MSDLTLRHKDDGIGNPTASRCDSNFLKLIASKHPSKISNSSKLTIRLSPNNVQSSAAFLRFYFRFVREDKCYRRKKDTRIESLLIKIRLEIVRPEIKAKTVLCRALILQNLVRRTSCGNPQELLLSRFGTRRYPR